MRLCRDVPHSGTHLSADDCPTSKDEIEERANRPYMELVGAIAWLTLGTRLDIAFATVRSPVLGSTPVASSGMWLNE